MSQYPTQAVQMISAGNSSECPSQSQDLRTSSGENIGSRNDSLREEASEPSFCNKKARVSEDDGEKGLLSSGVHLRIPVCTTGDRKVKSSGEVSQVVPDVASAIEDLLEQTSKVKMSQIFHFHVAFQVYRFFHLYLFFLFRFMIRSHQGGVCVIAVYPFTLRHYKFYFILPTFCISYIP